MGSIFHGQNVSEGGFFKKRQPLHRHTQSMGNYFVDLVSRWKWILLGLFLLASTAIYFTHKPKRLVARSHITFQLGNAIQIGMVNPQELQSVIGQTDKIRDRQLGFLGSYEFARIFAREIIENKDYAAILSRLSSQQFPVQRRTRFTEKLRQHYKVEASGDNNIVIEVEIWERQLSLDIARALSEVALKVIKLSQLQNFNSSITHLESQIEELKRDIDETNGEMFKFKKTHNLLSTSTIPDSLRNSITSLHKSLLDAEIQLNETENLIAETDKRIVESGEKILATTGVGYHDQVVEARRQELSEQKAILIAKIQGIKSFITKENSKFEFVASGEEKINQIKLKLNVKYDQLNQTELKLNNMRAMREQVDFSIRSLGDTFIFETRNAMSLGTKLFLINVSLFFVATLGLFYWYEFFPVLSYRDPSVANMNALSVPWMSGKGGVVEKQAERLCAQKILDKLPGPGMHQVLSAHKGDGKSKIIELMAQELVKKGEKVCVVNLSGSGKYPSMPSEVRVVSESSKLDLFIQNPNSIQFMKGDATWVLVDSDSLQSQMGHLLVSPHMDGIIFVGSYLQTRTENFHDWHLKIEQIAGKKAVFVLNKTDLRVDLPFLLMAPAEANNEKSSRKVS